MMKIISTHMQETPYFLGNGKNITEIQNKQIIDIGCGGGIYTKELALMGAKNVVGLDFSKEILHAAKENCNNFSNISFIHGDAHNIPYPNETFDIVISRAVIHHLQEIPTFYVKLLVY